MILFRAKESLEHQQTFCTWLGCLTVSPQTEDTSNLSTMLRLLFCRLATEGSNLSSLCWALPAFGVWQHHLFRDFTQPQTNLRLSLWSWVRTALFCRLVHETQNLLWKPVNPDKDSGFPVVTQTCCSLTTKCLLHDKVSVFNVRSTHDKISVWNVQWTHDTIKVWNVQWTQDTIKVWNVKWTHDWFLKFHSLLTSKNQSYDWVTMSRI